MSSFNLLTVGYKAFFLQQSIFTFFLYFLQLFLNYWLKQVSLIKLRVTKALFDKLLKIFKSLKMKIFNGFNFLIYLITKF